MTRKDYINDLFEVYDLVSVLSDKNDCRVLRLRHKELGKDVVIRSYPKAIEAYCRLAEIECDNIPTVYDAVELSDGQIVLEEFIDGITLAQVMDAEKFIYKKAKLVLKELCGALSVLHSLGFVHRDIKPENIMLNANGNVMLIDLNASRMVKGSGLDTVIMGTVGYTSPEQLGISQSDARTDIYAVGVLLNVILTGNHPSFQLARGKAGGIVKKCTAINPNDRYRNTRALINAL